MSSKLSTVNVSFSGLLAEDAPDILANTFLAEVSEEQLDRIGRGFLAHSHLRLAIFGHLAWTAQHASGNRGDDFRALKLCELQPYNITHPNGRTVIYSVLGLQGEEKAGKRGMRTVINPSYSAFIAHSLPEMCPLGAFALYFHWLHDVKELATSMDIDWTVNKSWRQVRVLHGHKAATVPFNEQSLHNLYTRAYKAAGFKSRLKAHLPRHLLGYKQAEMNVDAAETSKMGWVRGQTYADTYAPALPRKAILGAAGYRADDTYDPIWRHVRVPERFLELVCPMAEEIHASVVDKANLSGTTNHWVMVQTLRPYLFQCAAALMETCPDSVIFKLPALANTDVRNWMQNDFPTQFSLLKAKAGNPVDLGRIQNESLRAALQEVRSVADVQNIELKKLRELVERRTAVLSPTKGFSAATYHRNNNNAAASSSSNHSPIRSPIIVHLNERSEETGTYQIENDPTLRAFVNPRPVSPGTPRATTQVDLVLPPTAAFYDRGMPVGAVPPLLGQTSVQWTTVFECIKRPELCWDVWGLKRTLEQFESIDNMWSTYAVGEAVYNSEGFQTGVKPPIQLVEKYFRSTWRCAGTQTERKCLQKHWQRFREIPEWIAAETDRRHVSPSIIIGELEDMQEVDGKAKKGLSWLTKHVAELRKAQAESSPEDNTSVVPAASKSLSEEIASTAMNQVAATAVTSSVLGPAFVLQSASEPAERRKRSKAVDARRPKKAKLQ